MILEKLKTVKRMAWARLCLGIGGFVLLTAPFLPYTTITVGTWNLQLRGIFLTGLGLVICAAVMILQAALGRGSLLWSWVALFVSGLSLRHDVQICLKDIGLALGKVQLAFAGINQALMSFGFPPLDLVEAQQISHRQIEMGIYWAGLGMALAFGGTIVWLTVQGRQAVWACARRCACGRRLIAAFRYCPSCGELINSANVCYCRNCGSKCEEDWRYCVRCGTECK